MWETREVGRVGAEDASGGLRQPGSSDEGVWR